MIPLTFGASMASPRQAWRFPDQILVMIIAVALVAIVVFLARTHVHAHVWEMAAVSLGVALLLLHSASARAATLRFHQLRNESMQLQNIIQGFPSMIIGVDAHGRIVLINTYATSILDVRNQEVLGRTLSEVGLPIAWERLASQNPGLENEGTRLDDIPLVRSSGEPCYLGITMYRYPEEMGAIRILLLGTDVTERRKIDALSLQNLKLESVGQLASGIAHEINTPLQYIGDNLDFLGEFVDRMFTADGGSLLSELVAGRVSAKSLEELNLPYLAHEVPQALLQTKDGVDRITHIVKAMKSFSHPDTETPLEIDLNQCIQNVVTIAHGQCKHAADVIMDFDTNLGNVRCHPGSIGQVILNLIINATHAIESAHQGRSAIGTITIATRRKPDAVEVSVSDTGCGIPLQVQRRIFDPFFTTKPVGIGTGQGLFIARRIIERGHGGTITFETEEGKGTRFIITLPTNWNGCTLSPDNANHRELRSLTAVPIRIPFPRT